jgi:hypothetical protein
VPGTYEGATRYPFQAATVPGLSVYGNGRGCNTSTGRFIVHTAQFGSTGALERFHASFRQHCEGSAPALTGEIVVVASSPTPGPPPPAPSSTQLSMVSDSGDYIGGGQTRTYTAANVRFVVAIRNGSSEVEVQLIPFGSPFTAWTLTFAAPAGQALSTRTYTGATRYPFQSAAAAGLSVYGEGRGCNTLTGFFVVHEFVPGPSGGFARFRVTFEQHCEGLSAALRGDLMIIGEPPQ